MRRLWSVAAAWVLLIVLGTVVCAQAQSEVGTVAAVVGTLQIGRAGTWQRAAVGAPVVVGDRLRTGPSDMAKVVCRDDSVLDVAPNTEVVLDKQIFDPGARRVETLLRLLKGKVRAWVSEYYQQPKARYEVETPTAIAGVRGTEFITVFDPTAELTDVVGIAGAVEVAGKLAVLGGSVQIGPRLLTRVEKGRFPTAPRRLDDALFRQYLGGLEITGTGRRDGLNMQHPATAGRVLARQDVPPAEARAPLEAGLRVAAPQGSLADRLSPDIATNLQPLLDYRATSPGRVPAGNVHVGF